MKSVEEFELFKNEVKKLLRRGETGEWEEVSGERCGCARKRDLYQSLAVNILKYLIEPRMEFASEQFENASLEVNADAGFVRLSFLPVRLPGIFYLSFFMRSEPNAKMLRLYAESCLKPFTMDYEPSASLIIPLNAPNLKQAESFVEDQILKFLEGYLRLRFQQAKQPRGENDL